MGYRFIKCCNPRISHIKMIYGHLLIDWPNYKCDCGYDFELFTDLISEFIDDPEAFNNVNPDDDTKIYPPKKEDGI